MEVPLVFGLLEDLAFFIRIVYYDKLAVVLTYLGYAEMNLLLCKI